MEVMTDGLLSTIPCKLAPGIGALQRIPANVLNQNNRLAAVDKATV